MKKSSFSLLIATWFKTGLIPPILLKGMAGTYGSFFALPLCFLAVICAQSVVQWFDLGEGTLIVAYLCFPYFIFFIGRSVINDVEKELGPQIDWKGKEKDRDQNQIVIDEVFGMLISCFPILFLDQYSWIHFAAAFILFRIFDIVKISPTRYFDRKKNEYGVMLDDGVAGAYTAIILQILIWYAPWIF